MIIDSSAFMAILLQEPDAGRFSLALEEADVPQMSAATLVELGAVCLRRGGVPLANEMRLLLSEAGVEVVPLTADLAWSAVEAYRRFGLGTGNPACLNLGDCFSYALARELNRPLLFKGNDFARTDIRSAL